GGSVAKSGDLLLDPARKTVPQCSYPSVSARVHIVVTELGEDGPILGCGWLARQAQKERVGPWVGRERRSRGAEGR
ncbi:MAG: hypothetical protein JSV36_17565, partial [Anaerolineae bacterium]